MTSSVKTIIRYIISYHYYVGTGVNQKNDYGGGVSDISIEDRERYGRLSYKMITYFGFCPWTMCSNLYRKQGLVID